jgi:hypothetical protein
MLTEYHYEGWTVSIAHVTLECELTNPQVGDCCYDFQHGHIIMESREELLEGGVAAGALKTTHPT